MNSLERNLRLIPIHELLVRTNPWIAVFVLFTRARFDLDGAIQLAGIYYLAVVVFEVPSGWMSDRLGRALTLRVAAVAWIVSFSCFLIADQWFVGVAIGQVMLAVGFASLSGTDVTFHYDTLEALGRQHEYADRQAWVSSRGLLASAAGALLGGALGLLDRRWAFVVSLVLAVAQFAIASRFDEPPHEGSADRFASQINLCLQYLSHAPVAWIFGYGVAMVVLEHVAFTLFAPWLTVALGESADSLGSTPMIAGASIAAIAFVGSFFARFSAVLGRRLGVRVVLVGLGALSAAIVTTMALSTSLLVLFMIVFRSAQGVVAPVLISAAVAPVIAREHRATFLSLDSLAGRLSYGSLLLVISTDVSDNVGRALGQLAIVSWALVAIVGVTAVVVWSRGREPYPT